MRPNVYAGRRGFLLLVAKLLGFPDTAACPECGTFPIVEQRTFWPAYFVRCPRCFIAGPDSGTDVGAVRAWNEGVGALPPRTRLSVFH